MQDLIDLFAGGDDVVLPVMQFSFGQIPGFFSSDRFFLIISQLIIQVIEGFTTGFITLFTDGLFGVPIEGVL